MSLQTLKRDQLHQSLTSSKKITQLKPLLEKNLFKDRFTLERCKYLISSRYRCIIHETIQIQLCIRVDVESSHTLSLKSFQGLKRFNASLLNVHQWPQLIKWSLLTIWYTHRISSTRASGKLSSLKAMISTRSHWTPMSKHHLWWSEIRTNEPVCAAMNLGVATRTRRWQSSFFCDFWHPNIFDVDYKRPELAKFTLDHTEPIT